MNDDCNNTTAPLDSIERRRIQNRQAQRNYRSRRNKYRTGQADAQAPVQADGHLLVNSSNSSSNTNSSWEQQQQQCQRQQNFLLQDGMILQDEQSETSRAGLPVSGYEYPEYATNTSNVFDLGQSMTVSASVPPTASEISALSSYSYLSGLSNCSPTAVFAQGLGSTHDSRPTFGTTATLIDSVPANTFSAPNSILADRSLGSGPGMSDPGHPVNIWEPSQAPSHYLNPSPPDEHQDVNLLDVTGTDNDLVMDHGSHSHRSTSSTNSKDSSPHDNSNSSTESSSGTSGTSDDINRPGSLPDYISPLHIASQRGHTAIVALLLRASVPISETDSLGRTALQLAIIKNHLDVARLLLLHGAEVNSGDAKGRTALHWVVLEKNEQLLKILVEAGADANSCDANGWSPLHLAIERGWEVGFRILMDKGGNLSLSARKCENWRKEEPSNSSFDELSRAS